MAGCPTNDTEKTSKVSAGAARPDADDVVLGLMMQEATTPSCLPCHHFATKAKMVKGDRGYEAEIASELTGKHRCKRTKLADSAAFVSPAPFLSS